MVREIGSEFHIMPQENGQGIEFPYKGSLVFSGRTAIETILKEQHYAKKALLPSYCCESMIRPFREAGIEVEFYPVFYNCGLRIDFDVAKDVDIVLWNNYFGFKMRMPDLSAFIDRGGLVIEDITHSLLSDDVYSKSSHYLVASIRKWEPIYCGGYCAAVNENLRYAPSVFPPEDFLQKKNKAMTIKSEYLDDLDENKKIVYLSMFKDTNHWIEENYSGLTIDDYSREYLSHVNVDKQKRERRRNAKILYKGLPNIQFLFPEEDMDCPLFVPIVMENDKRDKVRKVLLENKVYCPIHWPRPHDACESNIYDLELSLVCDQRYSEKDMERVVDVLTNY